MITGGTETAQKMNEGRYMACTAGHFVAIAVWLGGLSRLKDLPCYGTRNAAPEKSLQHLPLRTLPGR